MWFNKLNIRGLKYFIYFFTLIFNHLFSLKLLINPLSLLWLLCDTLCNNYFLLYHKSTEKPQNTQRKAAKYCILVVYIFCNFINQKIAFAS